MRNVILLVALAACAKTTAPIPRPAPPPAALAPHAFTLPESEERTLTNGVRVIVAANHEVPVFDVRIAFSVGDYADPAGKEGLAAVTFDMLNEGVEGMSAEDIAREQKRLGSTVYSAGDDDGATIGAAGVLDVMDPTLDLWAKVLLKPSFPAGDWEVNRTQRISALRNGREDVRTIGSRVGPTLLWGPAYKGRLVTEESLASITVDDMRAFYTRFAGPSNAVILVGGDVDADQVVAKLETRLGTWRPAAEHTEIKPASTRKAGQFILVDKPGAAQSIVKFYGDAPTRTDGDYFPALVANEAFGGAFTSRLNLNLREDKGYTYGYRCGLVHGYGPSFWSCSGAIQTDKTGPAIDELRKELAAVNGDKPLTAAEIQTYRDAMVYGFPGAYELNQAILDDAVAIWRYGLPADFTETYVKKLEAVTPDQANKAIHDRLTMDQVTWLVVGDAATIRPEIEKLGFTVTVVDRDGKPIEGK